MRTYSLPEGLWLSFYSKAFYQTIRKQWRGAALVYLGLVLTLTSAPTYIQLHSGFKKGIEHLREKIVSQVPAFSITKGEVHTPKEIPYTITFGSDPKDVVVIDTTGKNAPFQDLKATALLTKKTLFVRKSPTEIRIYDLTQVQDMQVDGDKLNHWINLLEKWFPIVFYPFVFGLLYAKAFFTAFFLAILGALLNRWVEADLSLAELLTLAIVSLTPRLLMDLFMQPTPNPSFGAMFLNIWLTVIYFFFAINAATDTPVED